MAKFAELSDDQLRNLGARIIRNAKSRIDKQIPTPSRNPFSKGNLARSMSYSWEQNSDGSWELVISYLPYGNYVNFGTRNYSNAAMREQSFFGYSYRGYQKAKGGIRPQGFLSLRGDRPVYEAIVEAEVRITWEEFIENTISKFTREQ